MPAGPVTSKRLVAGARRRVRRVRRRLAARHNRAGLPVGRLAGGRVEEFVTARVAGEVTVVDGKAVRVGLYANDLEVAAAWASDPVPGRDDVRAFQLRLRHIWDYVAPEDVLTVRVDGALVPIEGHGRYLRPTRRGRRTLPELRDKMSAGQVFGQGGRLQLSKKLDTEWQATVMGLYARVRELVAAEFGYDVFLVYGTLLGAVREGSVIGHDVDFDCAFVSGHTTGREAAADLRDIAFLLIERGFDVECRRTALHLHDHADPAVRIDLFHFYFDDRGELASPFGTAGTSVITSQQWPGMKEIDFCGARALVPENDEAFAEHLYGETWRLPKPGFDWHRDRTTRAREGILPIPFVTPVIWENAYAHRPAQPDPSSFAAATLARPDLPATVIDIGCGDGRDTVAFAAAGHRAVGLDRSPRGVALATGRGSAAEFEVADVTDPMFGTRLAELRGDEPVLFYLRFLVHAVDDAGEKALLAALAAHSRPGDLVAAEFRTDDDEWLPKAFGKHYRRFVPGAAFDERLIAAGFEVLDTADGTGLAVLDKEDPELHRVFARRG